MLFHLHKWVEVKRTYTPAPGRKVTTYSDETLRIAILGVTTVELQCAVCGKPSFVQTPGRID